MLDLFRRKQRGLKFVLWIVIIGLGAGMLLLFVDVGSQSGPGGFSSNQVVASVDGKDINALQFRNVYYSFYDSYRRYYNVDSSNNELLKALRVDRMALDKLIKDTIVQGEAKRLGLEVSQEEIVDALRKIPGLNENGRFIGRARLEQMLRANNSNLTDFEANLVGELLSQKVRGIVCDSVQVSEDDMRKDFTENSQRATIEYVLFKPDDSLSEVTVVEADLRPFYEKNKEQYRVGEQRRIKYLQVTPDDFRAKVTLTDAEIRNAYDSEGDHTEVHARHILLKVEDPAKESEMRTKGESILAEARQGQDFAELAKKYSQDGSAATGGDLGYFKRGAMVQEFSDVAFNLEPGKISDLVRSQFGFHIIKVEGKRSPTFEEMKAQLEFQLKGQKAEELARTKADEAVVTLKTTPDMAKVAKDMGLEVRESGLFRVDGSIPLLGEVAGLQQEVFGMKTVGEVGTPHKAALGFIVPQFAEKKDSFIPDLSEVRDTVLEAYKKDKAGLLAESKAKQFAASLREGVDMAAAAAKVKAKPVKPAPFTRRGTIDDALQQTVEVMNQVFTLPLGKFSPAVRVNANYVVFQLLSRDDFDAAKYASEKATIRERLESLKKTTLFQAYLEGLDSRMRKAQKIKVNQDLIDKIVG